MKGWSAGRRAVGLGVVVAVAVLPAAGQEGAAGIGARLLQEAAVAAAVAAARANEAQTLEEQVALCEIPAPPFAEARRAEAFRQRFEALGLANVRVDEAGNVLGERPGLATTPHLVFSAHLDTVFPEGTDVTTSREGSVLKGPGIGDDCRGLAVLLAVVRAMQDAKVQTPGSITFVGTVGEEGLGDLRGVKHLFTRSLAGSVDRFVSIDGTGLSVTHVAVGSKRYRVTYRGPGGHSFGAFGLVSPIHALGRAIARISEFEVPTEPKTTFNVGRVGGGTSVNSIAFDAWMEVDMRSSDTAALTALDATFHDAVDAALADENARWQRGRLTVDKELVGDRPAGRIATDAPVVRAAVSVTEALGFVPELREGSTDANLPISLGIPAVTIGGGGRGTDAHALSEAFDTTDSWQGTQRALLLAIALAQR